MKKNWFLRLVSDLAPSFGARSNSGDSIYSGAAKTSINEFLRNTHRSLVVAEERLQNIDVSVKNEEKLEALHFEIIRAASQLDQHPNLVARGYGRAAIAASFSKRQRGQRDENLRRSIRYYDEALSYYESALKIKAKPNVIWLTAASYCNLGAVYIHLESGNQRRNLVKAIKYFTRGLKLFRRGKFRREIVKTKSDLAKIKGQLKQRPKLSTSREPIDIIATTEDLPALRVLLSPRSAEWHDHRTYMKQEGHDLLSNMSDVADNVGSVLIVDTRAATADFRAALLDYCALPSHERSAGTLPESLLPFVGSDVLPDRRDPSFQSTLDGKADMAECVESSGDLDEIWRKEDQETRALLGTLVAQKSPFGLYLRNFDLEAGTGSLNKPFPGWDKGSRVYYCQTRPRVAFEEDMAVWLGTSPPILAAANQRDLLGYRRPFPRLYLNTTNWLEELGEFIGYAAAIVVHMTSYSSSIQFELDLIRKVSKQGSTVIVLSGHERTETIFDQHVVWDNHAGFPPERLNSECTDALDMFDADELKEFAMVFVESGVRFDEIKRLAAFAPWA